MGATAPGALPPGLGQEALAAGVRACLDRHLHPGDVVLVACSGGPDSTALVHLVAAARPDLSAAVAHVRHRLRDDARDAAVAAAHARALGLPFHQRDVVVSSTGEGPEAAARRARYEALVEVADRTGAGWVLVGHTADDQAETVLLNLARGAGLRGLGGMAEARAEGAIRVLRPLLRIRRADVRDFVRSSGLEAVSDPTNLDPEQRRARARHHLLPALAGLAGDSSDVVGALTRLADLARQDADALEALAAAWARRHVVPWGPVRAVRADALHARPRAVAARVVRLMIAAVRGGADDLGARAVATVLALGPGQAMHVPGGVLVTMGGGWIAAAPGDLEPLPDRHLAVPGRVALPEVGVTVHADAPVAERRHPSSPKPAGEAPPPAGPFASLPPRKAGGRGAASRPWVVVDCRLDALQVRARRPGERMRTPAGSRKLQDLLVDAGVPRPVRDLVPVVADEEGPLWVPGVAARAGDGPRLRLWLAPLGPGTLE